MFKAISIALWSIALIASAALLLRGRDEYPDDLLSVHRGAIPQNWNVGCATCASTNLQQAGMVDECACGDPQNDGSVCIICQGTAVATDLVTENHDTGQPPGYVPTTLESCTDGENKNQVQGKCQNGSCGGFLIPIGWCTNGVQLWWPET